MLPTPLPRAFTSDVQNGLSEDKTPNDFGFTRSKAKRVTIVKIYM